MQVSESLRRFRNEADLSQKEVARRLSIVQQVWQRYETGQVKPTAEFIARVARTFGVSADYLLGLSEVPRPVGVEETEVKKAREFREALKKFVADEPNFVD